MSPLGVFKDGTIEEWYLIWRAENISLFYKRMMKTNLFLNLINTIFVSLVMFSSQALVMLWGSLRFPPPTRLRASASPVAVFRRVARETLVVACRIAFRMFDFSSPALEASRRRSCLGTGTELC